MADPRADNCRAFRVDAGGKVTGVELVYVPNPSTPYELVRAELIDEAAAGGNTVASCTVLDKDGIQTGEKVWLAWVFPGMGDGKLLPGNPDGRHMITNGYNARESHGPLGLYVGDAAGNVISDVIGGLGLPDNRHVCYRFTWKARDGAGPGTDPEPGGGSELLEMVWRAVVALERLVVRFGA